MMLDVADINELVLQFRHAIPTEATLSASEIQGIHFDIAEAIGAEFPAFADIGQKTIDRWLESLATNAANDSPPESRQHFTRRSLHF
jgi:hypothetical protein